jgi:hypothetical protein
MLRIARIAILFSSLLFFGCTDGTGTDDQTAREVPVFDQGKYFDGRDLEAVTQEIGRELAASKIGTATVTTDGAGNAVVEHDLGFAPTAILLSSKGKSLVELTYHGITKTSFTVKAYSGSGVALPRKEITFSWLAKQ